MADTFNTRTDRKRNDRSVNVISGVRELRNGIENLLSDSPRSRPGSGLVDSLTNSLISSGLVNAGDYYSGAGSGTIQEGFDYTGIPGGNYLGMLTPKDAAELVFNHNEALYDRQFQEYMSNTSYQRAVADMSAAGINPVLAYRNGGAITPSGSAAAAPSGSSAMDVLGLLVNLLGQKNQLAIADVQADATIQSAQIAAEASKYKTDMDRIGVEADAAYKGALKAGVELDNQFKDKSMLDRLRSAKSNADLSEEEVNACKISQSHMLAQIHLFMEQANTEASKRTALVAQAALSHAEAWQIGQITSSLARMYNKQADNYQIEAITKEYIFSSGQLKAIADQAEATARSMNLSLNWQSKVDDPQNVLDCIYSALVKTSELLGLHTGVNYSFNNSNSTFTGTTTSTNTSTTTLNHNGAPPVKVGGFR